jgi:chromosome condensin MukBEF complex kleisin-like MukF subunit
MITDLYSYFQQPWAMAIFHDRFLDFRDEIRELLISRPTGNEESLEETIRLLMENDSSLTEGQKNML